MKSVLRLRSFFVSIPLRAARNCRTLVISSIALLTLLMAPGAVKAQYLSYAGMQTAFPVSGVPQPIGIALDAAGNRYIVGFSSPNITEVSAGGTTSTINSTLLNPYGIAVDAVGNLYVADSGNNRVLEIPVGGGSQTTVGSGLMDPTSVALDSLGNVYIVDYGHSRLVKVAAGGGQTVIADGSFSQPSAVAVDAYNNAYVTDEGDNTLVEVPASGSVSFLQNNTLPEASNGVAVDRFGSIFVSSESGVVTLYGGGGLVRSLGSNWSVPIGLAADGAGNVYVADPGAGQIRLVAPGAVDIGQANVCPSSGTQTPPCSQTVTLNYNVQASLQNISSVAVKVSLQGAENLDYTETANTCTGDFSTDTTCAITVNFAPSAPGIRLGAVDVVGVLAPLDDVVPLGSAKRHASVPQATPQFTPPAGATELSAVYVHGIGSGPIAAFDAGLIQTLAAFGDNGGYPSGITTDSAGNVYLVDESNCVVSKVTPNGTATVVAGSGSCGDPTGDGQMATSATFSDLWRVAIDSRGDLIINDPSASTIREVDGVTGIIETIAGTNQEGYSPDGTPATSALLGTPLAVAVDAAGNIFYADEGLNLVRRIDASSGQLTTVAGNLEGGRGDSGDGGPATSAQISSPYGMAIDSAGNIYLPDADDNVVRKVTASSGIITTIAGQSSVDAGYAGDGELATSAVLNDPEGVALDAAGNVYIADSSNLVVRKINAQSGIITTVAGLFNGGNESYTGDGKAATLAGLSYFEDVTVDGSGNFYIADSDNNVIRSVTVASGVAAFGSFAVGSSSPAIEFTLVNDGNSTLHLSGLSLPANFNLGGANTSCTPTSALTPGETCILGIEFLPITTGSLGGTLTATDNVGNNAASTQSVALTGTGTAAVASQLALSTIPATVAQGGNLGMVEVSVETSGSGVVTSSTASVTVTLTGPNSYSQQVMVNAVNGVATFNLASLTFATAGSYTITATSADLTQASASFTVTAGSPAAKLALSSIPATLAQGGDLGMIEVSVETSGSTVVTSSTASVTVTITGPNSYSQERTANAVSGVAAFDLTALTFAAAGDYTVTASSSGLTSAVGDFVVAQNFTLTPSASSAPPQTILPGAAAVYLLQLAPAGSTFTAPITLSATGLPPGATYTFNPPTVTPGAAAATSTLTVNTVRTTATMRPWPGTTLRPLRPWGLLALLPAAFLLPWAGSRQRRRKARGFPALPILLAGLLLAVAGLSGCAAGGLFSQPQTTYTITVTGTSGALIHSTTVTLTVQ
jgi:sugar lactone lactonase YvrE